jgi:hypothetical protein
MPLPLGDGDDASFMSDVSDVNPDELEKMIAVKEMVFQRKNIVLNDKSLN